VAGTVCPLTVSRQPNARLTRPAMSKDVLTMNVDACVQISFSSRMSPRGIGVMLRSPRLAFRRAARSVAECLAGNRSPATSRPMGTALIRSCITVRNNTPARRAYRRATRFSELATPPHQPSRENSVVDDAFINSINSLAVQCLFFVHNNGGAASIVFALSMRSRHGWRGLSHRGVDS